MQDHSHVLKGHFQKEYIHYKDGDIDLNTIFVTESGEVYSVSDDIDTANIPLNNDLQVAVDIKLNSISVKHENNLPAIRLSSCDDKGLQKTAVSLYGKQTKNQIINIYFANFENGRPFDEKTMQNIMHNIKSEYKAVLKGLRNFTFEGHLLTIPYQSASDCVNCSSVIHAAADTYMEEHNLKETKRVLFLPYSPQVSGRGVCGFSGIGSRFARVSYGCPGSAVHEIGHMLGLAHANKYHVQSQKIYEYGDATSEMGNAGKYGDSRFTAMELERLELHYPEKYLEITKTSRLRLSPIEYKLGDIPQGNLQAVIVSDDKARFYISTRSDRLRSPERNRDNEKVYVHQDHGTSTYIHELKEGESYIPDRMYHGQSDSIKIEYVSRSGEDKEIIVYTSHSDPRPGKDDLIGAEPTYQCTGELPANAGGCTVEDIRNLPYNLPIKLVALNSCTKERRCEYHCKPGFKPNLAMTGCVPKDNTPQPEPQPEPQPNPAPRDACIVKHYEYGFDEYIEVEIPLHKTLRVHAVYDNEDNRNITSCFNGISEYQLYYRQSVACKPADNGQVKSVVESREMQQYYLDDKCAPLPIEEKYKATYPIRTVLGDSMTANKLKMVLMPTDRVDSSKLRHFDRMVNSFIEDMLDEEPFRTYRDFLNIKVIRIPHTADSSLFGTSGADIKPAAITIADYHQMDYDFIGVFIPTRGFYSGTVAAGSSDAMLHEFGHHFGLPDEYPPNKIVLGGGKMNRHAEPFTPQHVEILITKLYTDYVDPIYSAYKTDTSIKVTPMKLQGRELKIEWRANGALFYPKNPKVVQLTEVPGKGSIEVSVTVIDDTSYVKSEAVRAKHLTQKLSWTVDK